MCVDNENKSSTEPDDDYDLDDYWDDYLALEDDDDDDFYGFGDYDDDDDLDRLDDDGGNCGC